MTINLSSRTPYRVACFGDRFGYILWNPVQVYREARLPDAGSFLFPGLHAVRAAALNELAKPGIHQVQIRTNQDRKVWIFNKQAGGKITGYQPDGGF